MVKSNVLKATITAKVVSVHTLKRGVEIIVLIKDISYTKNTITSIRLKHGTIKFDNYSQKARFFISEETAACGICHDARGLEYGNIIKFTIEGIKGHEYRFTTLSIKNKEECCYGMSGIAELIDRCGIDSED